MRADFTSLERTYPPSGEIKSRDEDGAWLFYWKEIYFLCGISGE